MRSSVFVLATGRFLLSEESHDRRSGRSAYSSSGHSSEGPPLLLGPLAPRDSDPRPASVGGLIDAVGSTRRIELLQHSRNDRPTRWVVQEPEALGWSTPRTPNHRVEMNRHQPPCLPTPPGHFPLRHAPCLRSGRVVTTVSVMANVFGQVAVSHSGRWAKLK